MPFFPLYKTALPLAIKILMCCIKIFSPSPSVIHFLRWGQRKAPLCKGGSLRSRVGDCQSLRLAGARHLHRCGITICGFRQKTANRAAASTTPSLYPPLAALRGRPLYTREAFPFAARKRQNQMKSFFAATCAWQKTLLAVQTCEQSECAAARRKPLPLREKVLFHATVQKKRKGFRLSSFFCS